MLSLLLKIDFKQHFLNITKKQLKKISKFFILFYVQTKTKSYINFI